MNPVTAMLPGCTWKVIESSCIISALITISACMNICTAPLVTPHSIRVQHEIDSISLTWTCGVAEHVELYYNVTISRDTDKDTVVMETNKTLISFGLDYPFAELCTNYTFSVVAWSELDTSNSSEPVTAGFHCPLPSIPSVSGMLHVHT